jgi:two-component sensor histidine kinase
LSVSVRDDGCGLPAEFDSSRSASLGLTIVRTLVESELGGRMQLDSGESGGTSVTLELPLS